MVLRIYKIDNPVADWHSFRQADTSSVAKVYSNEGIDILYPRYHDISTIQSGIFNPNGFRFVEFPLYNVLTALVYNAFPDVSIETWARLLSVFSAILSGVFIYLLGKRFMGYWGGILACSYFMFIPYNIYFTRVILPEPIATTFGLMGLWLFVYALDSNERIALFLSAITFSVALLLKPYTLFYLIPACYLLVEKYEPNGVKQYYKLIRSYIWFAVVILVPLLLWRYWEGLHPEGIPFYKWVFNGDGIRFRPSFWRWIFGERVGYLILGVWGLIPFSQGLSSKRVNRFVLMMLVGSLLYVSVVATANVRHDYYQTFIIPSISLVIASGTLVMLKGDMLQKSLLLFSVLIMLMVGLTKVREFYKIDHPEIINAGYAVEAVTPHDALVIAPYNGDTAFLYQTARKGWPYVDRPIDELIMLGADYYVSVNQDAQTKEFMFRFPTIMQTSEFVILDLGKRLAL